VSHDQGRACRCVVDHRPDPLELHEHHVFPLYLGGPKDGETVWLCPTVHTNTHELLRVMLRDGELSWRAVLDLYEQPVSRYAYGLAIRALHLYDAARAA